MRTNADVTTRPRERCRDSLVVSRHSLTRSRQTSTQAPRALPDDHAGSGCEQLGIEPLAKLARLTSFRLDETVPEDCEQLRRHPNEETFGCPRVGLDLEPSLGRTRRKLELVPG